MLLTISIAAYQTIVVSGLLLIAFIRLIDHDMKNAIKVDDNDNPIEE